MLKDCLPSDELLINAIIGMFRRNPDFVCEFIADVMKAGEEANKTKVKERWSPYA